jgi:hypothetical protein
VRVDAELSQLFVERYNDLKKSLNDNGTLECMRKDTVLFFIRFTIIIVYGFSRMFF